VELQSNLEKIRAEGLGVAAISYDSVAVLKSFAERRGITFLLLSDPESKIIRDFGIFNEQSQKGTMQYGIPYPGTYLVDRAGRVTAKYFEDDYTQRYTSADILVSHFGESAGTAQSTNTETWSPETVSTGLRSRWGWTHLTEPLVGFANCTRSMLIGAGSCSTAADIAAYRSASGSEVRRAGAVANNGIPHRPLIFATGLISTKADSG